MTGIHSFICLPPRHPKFKCRKRKYCDIGGCKLKHHNLLHKNFTRKEKYEHTIENCTLQTKENVLLHKIPRVLYGPNSSMKTSALCDEGSTVTLVDQSIVDTLGLQGIQKPLCIRWTGGFISNLNSSQKVNFTISAVGKQARIFQILGARTTHNSSLRTQSLNIDEWKNQYHLKDFSIEHFSNEIPLILIGQDNAASNVPRHVRSIHSHLRIATKCKLECLIHGPCHNDEADLTLAHTLHICNKAEDEQTFTS
ncbi:hypothetical protein JTB14_024248 [Gonioctena quinquepunctata]|nr:hypothetical protein JTB14_024248 [Gonioctena quinquepunctata]